MEIRILTVGLRDYYDALRVWQLLSLGEDEEGNSLFFLNMGELKHRVNRPSMSWTHRRAEENKDKDMWWSGLITRDDDDS